MRWVAVVFTTQPSKGERREEEDDCDLEFHVL